MASTTVQIDVPEQVAPVTAFLTTTAAGQTAADSAGYAMSLSSSIGWLYTIIVTEACTGIYRIECQDGDGATVAQGWVDIEADDTGTYIADASYHVLKARDEVQVVDTNVDAVLVDTAELQSDWTNGGRLDVILDAILADTAELQGDWTNGGRLDVILDAILADTDALQQWLTDGGRLDLLIDAIKAKTDLVATSAAPLNTLDAGVIVRIVRGADYKAVNNRQFVWTIIEPGNIAAPANAVCTFSGRKRDEDATTANKWSVTGTAADVGDGTYTLSFDLAASDTVNLELGEYEWSVEIIDDSGNKIVPVLSDRQRLTRLVEKFN